MLKDYTPPHDAPSIPVVPSDNHHHNDATNNDVALASGGSGGRSLSDSLDPLPPSLVEPVQPDFDRCLPMIMESVLDDLNGDSQEDRETEAKKAIIREAKGNKANDTLEISARCLLFRPTYALLSLDDPSAISSVHALASPLLAVLRDATDSAEGIAATDLTGGHTALVG